jgi:hypothetical protein
MLRVDVVVVVVKRVCLVEVKLWKKEDLRLVWQRRCVMNMETEGWQQQQQGCEVRLRRQRL